MKTPSRKSVAISLGLLVIVAAAIGAGAGGKATAGAAAPAAGGASAPKQQAALTVTTVQPQQVDWPLLLSANGNIAAWQESVVGSEVGGLRLAEVTVNVGDEVRRGQVLARFSADTVAAEVAEQEAAVDLARAALSEAEANAEGARLLTSSGALSAQQTKQYLTAELSARARLKAALARLRQNEIRLRQTQVLAPDDGVISARSATVGTVTAPGAELFRLIRQGRLEWRANVISSDLLRVKRGARVTVTAANGVTAVGKVRMVAPTVSPSSRNTIVYVDLPPGAGQAGMFASGQFELGHATALTVPQRAVLARDGYNYLYQVGAGDRIVQTPVTLGRRQGERVEVLSGATPSMRLVSEGAGFLADGDPVRVVAPPPAALAAR